MKFVRGSLVSFFPRKLLLSSFRVSFEDASTRFRFSRISRSRSLRSTRYSMDVQAIRTYGENNYNSKVKKKKKKRKKKKVGTIPQNVYRHHVFTRKTRHLQRLVSVSSVNERLRRTTYVIQAKANRKVEKKKRTFFLGAE